MNAEVFIHYHWAALNIGAMILFAGLFIAMMIWVFMLKKESISYFESLPLGEESHERPR